MVWLLQSIKPSASFSVREAAAKELKGLIKSAEDSFWVRNYAQVTMVLLESFRSDAPPSHQMPAPSSLPAVSLEGFENAHFSTKSLMQLMRYRGPLMKNLLEILVSTLASSAYWAPAPLGQTFELILCEFARYDCPRLMEVILPYANMHQQQQREKTAPTAKPATATAVEVASVAVLGEHPTVRLLALHVLCSAMRFLTSAQLLQLLPRLAPVVLASLNSAMADIRKAVVFVLVEVYLSVGEALFPYIRSLTPPQRKLLTIYIEKRLAQRRSMVHH